MTQQVTLPLYVPPPSHGQHQGAKSSPSSTGAPASAADTEPNVFPRQVVYDPQRDELEGARGLQPQGRLVLRVRYLLERRTRCHVPSECDVAEDRAARSRGVAWRCKAVRRRAACPSLLRRRGGAVC